MRSTLALVSSLALASASAFAQSSSAPAADSASDTVGTTRFALAAMDSDSLPSGYRDRAYFVLRQFLPALEVDGSWQRDIVFTVHADRSVTFRPAAAHDVLQQLLERGISDFARGGTFTPLPGPSPDTLPLVLRVIRHAAAHPSSDSAYAQAAVDKPVRARASFTTPKYPPQLRPLEIGGSVVAQFVVDTSGRADLASFRVLSATDPLFAQSVRDAIGQYRYEPAQRGGKKVRQVVQQTFTFVPAREPIRRVPALPLGSARPNGSED